MSRRTPLAVRSTALSVLVVAGLLAPSVCAQDGSRAVIRVRPDCRFAPLHTSAPLAVAASVGATAALVGAGYGIYRWMESQPVGGLGDDAALVGLVVMGLGAMVGPGVGNLTLGAGDTFVTGQQIRLVGLGIGSGVGLAAVAIALVCTGDCGPGLGTVGIAALVISGATAAGAAVYDLATIPRNAGRARADRAARRIAFAPTAGGLSVRVPL